MAALLRMLGPLNLNASTSGQQTSLIHNESVVDYQSDAKWLRASSLFVAPSGVTRSAVATCIDRTDTASITSSHV